MRRQIVRGTSALLVAGAEWWRTRGVERFWPAWRQAEHDSAGLTERRRLYAETAVVLVVVCCMIAVSRIAEGGGSSPGPVESPQPPPAVSDPDQGEPALPERGAREPVPVAMPVPPDLPTHAVPLDIPHDCSVDVTATLNAWVAGVPNAGRILFPAGACYRVEGSITLTGREQLLIEGNGATFRATSPVDRDVNRAQWHLDYGVTLVLRNMTLSGANPKAVLGQDTGYDHNIFIRGSRDVLIDGVTGGNTYGDFVAVAHGKDDTTIPGGITVINSRADNVGRMGVSCVACDGLTVENSVFTGVALHVFNVEIEGDGWPGRNVRIVNNTVGSHGWAFFSIGTPFQTEGNDISNIYIAGNLMTEASIGWCESAVSLTYSRTWQSNLVIESNTLISTGTAVSIRSTTGVAVAGNELRHVWGNCDEETPAAVVIRNSSSVDVRDNELAGYGTEVHVHDDGVPR